MLKKISAIGAGLLLATNMVAAQGNTKADLPEKVRTSAALAPLQFEVYNPQEKSMFPVTSTLITGPKEAILFDAQFQKNDANNLVKIVKSSGKQLKAIYISHFDPDFYFGLDVLTDAFPTAEVLATPATVNKMKSAMEGKKKYWGPILKENAPERLVLPKPLTTDQLFVDGTPINIIGMKGHDPLRTFGWVASEKTVVGGGVLYEGQHVWMADNQSSESRKSWLKTLHIMKKLNPKRVIAGHFLGKSTEDTSVIDFTKRYVKTFDKVNTQTATADDQVKEMIKRFPNLKEVGTLELSAKVIKGDMKWPQ